MEKKKCILVVDDDPDILSAISFVLDEQYETISSVNADSVFSLLDRMPDAILLDVWLNGKDGREISRELRKMHGYEQIPIIMMSAHPLQRESILEYGANDFLPKPFDIYHLLDTVNKYIH